MPTNTDTESVDADRYRYIQYNDDDGTVTVIQDTENHQAWIQSTVYLTVER